MLVNIKEGVACQQHLTEVGPNSLAGVRVAGIGLGLVAKESFGSHDFVLFWQTAIGQFKCEGETGNAKLLLCFFVFRGQDARLSTRNGWPNGIDALTKIRKSRTMGARIRNHIKGDRTWIA